MPPVKLVCSNPACHASFTVHSAQGTDPRCAKCGWRLGEDPSGGTEHLPGVALDGAAPSPPTSATPSRSPFQPRPSLEPGAFVGDQFEVRQLLGSGGMASVYLAYDHWTGREVALKLPHPHLAADPDFLERFEREARTVARFHHPNFCLLHQVGRQDNGLPFLVLAYIRGQTLASLIQHDGPMPPRRAAEVVRALAEALEEAHRERIIHRDLKPENVMVNHRGDLVIMDFGVARRMGHDATITTYLVGTPAYMAPEQAASDFDAIGPRTDIYALGVILFELLTGRRPYREPYPKVLEIIRDPAAHPPRPSQLAPGLDRRLEIICLKAMAKAPQARFASMAELADALSAYLDATKPDQDPPPHRRRRPEPERVDSVGLTLVLVPAGEFLMGSPDSEPAASPREKPRHRVTLSRPFYLAACPVTQDQYQRVVGRNPSHFRGQGERPVDQVSWLDAVAFCNALSAREGLTPYYRIAGPDVAAEGGDGYRLPTEAEWEYACRAGSDVPYGVVASPADLARHAWFHEGHRAATHPVGQKAPNPFGLYDLQGNVWEWCWDRFAPYPGPARRDPTGPDSGPHRVLRGGSVLDAAPFLRCAHRNRSAPDHRHPYCGFRVARSTTD